MTEKSIKKGGTLATIGKNLNVFSKNISGGHTLNWSGCVSLQLFERRVRGRDKNPYDHVPDQRHYKINNVIVMLELSGPLCP